MPSIGTIISAGVIMCIGCALLVYSMRIKESWLLEKTSFWETNVYLSENIALAIIGIGVVLWGTDMMIDLHWIAIVMLIPGIAVMRFSQGIGHALLAVFTKGEVTETKIRICGYAVLTLAAAWSVWAVFLSLTGKLGS